MSSNMQDLKEAYKIIGAERDAIVSDYAIETFGLDYKRERKLRRIMDILRTML